MGGKIKKKWCGTRVTCSVSFAFASISIWIIQFDFTLNTYTYGNMAVIAEYKLLFFSA